MMIDRVGKGLLGNTTNPSDTVFAYVERLLRFAKSVEDGLDDEFYHTDSVTKDWHQTIMRLADACAPLNSLSNKGDIQNIEKLVKSINHSLYTARLCLRGESVFVCTSPAPEERIFRALDQVAGVRYDLSKLYEIVVSKVSTCELEEFSFPPRIAAERELLSDLSRLREAVLLEDDIERCMASRRVYLSAMFLLAVHPSLWDGECRNQVIEIHGDLIRCMAQSRYRQSIELRLEKLRALAENC